MIHEIIQIYNSAPELFICLGSYIYIIGFFITLSIDRKYNHNGFYGLGPATPKIVWMALFWPIRGFYILFKATISIIHESISIILLLFFIKYKYSKYYRIINTFLLK